MDDRSRLELSALTIDGWESVRRPGERPADTLKIIREELQALALIDDPVARELEHRYAVLATRLRLALD